MDVVNLLRECGALLEGHFLLSSGRHSDKYFQCARLLQYPDKAEAALRPLAERIKADMESGVLQVDAVAGPALGGIIPAYELGRLLGKRAFWTERDGAGLMTLRRGFEVSPGMNVLVAEDVVTTGKSSLETAAVLEKAGAGISALACIVDRREDACQLKFPLYAACKVKAGNWLPEDCALCGKGVPVVKPGSRPDKR